VASSPMDETTGFRFCPRCGGELASQLVDLRERLVCQACGFIFYINPKVAAGALVEDDGHVVLVRRGVEPGLGKWGLPSGFAEVDESIEETAIRECREETGLQIVVDDLLGVYSYENVTQGRGVLVLYAGHVVGGELRPGDDALEVGRFTPDEVPEDIAFRTHRRALHDWKKARAVTYRLATLAEADQAAQLGGGVPGGMGDHTAYITSEDRALFVAVDGSEVVARANLTLRRRNRTANLDDIFVQPSYRRWGIATRLIQHSIAFARQKRMRALTSEVPATNPALVVYLKAGFRVSGFDDTRYPPDGPDRGTVLFLAYDLD